jgi:hypothetical protein
MLNARKGGPQGKRSDSSREIINMDASIRRHDVLDT